jgi:hypothetical protein
VRGEAQQPHDAAVPHVPQRVHLGRERVPAPPPPPPPAIRRRKP